MILHGTPERLAAQFNRVASELGRKKPVDTLLRQGIVFYQSQPKLAEESGLQSGFTTEVIRRMEQGDSPLDAIIYVRQEQKGAFLTEKEKTTVLINTAIGGGLELASRMVLRLPHTERLRKPLKKATVVLYRRADWNGDEEDVYRMSVLLRQKQDESTGDGGDGILAPHVRQVRSLMERANELEKAGDCEGAQDCLEKARDISRKNMGKKK
jgi:hypothetical protein